MSAAERVAVGTGSGSDGDLLLPRAPGVMRRFWARHPFVTDVCIALLALLLSVPALALRALAPTEPSAAAVWIATGLAIAAAAALVLRRRRPLLAFVAAAVPTVFLPPSLAPVGHLLLAFAVYAIAVYRSARACWIALGSATVAIAASSGVLLLAEASTFGFLLSNVVSAVGSLIIGALIGVNVGNRRRYLDALIDRSRQLLVERDQQAELAAVAERTRIAREIHDIVSHSLTVVVALSEGAAAAATPERAREASRMAADTARGALEEMRAMLGVLRDDTEAASPLEPLEPLDPGDVVDAARRAGYPVTARVTGSIAAVPRATRFALGRVVQEALTNAMRHAPNATDIRLDLRIAADAITVEVRNDGAAPPAPGHSAGFGLRGIRERVELAGGRLDAGPAATPGEWMLRAVFPVSPASPSAAASTKAET